MLCYWPLVLEPRLSLWLQFAAVEARSGLEAHKGKVGLLDELPLRAVVC